MRTSLRVLATVQVHHDYVGGPFDGFEVVPSAEALPLLRSARLLARGREGQLHLLIETDGTGAPSIPPRGQWLRLGLRAKTAAIANVSVRPTTDTPVWRTTGVADTLAPPVARRVVGGLPRVRFTRSDRPVTVTVSDGAGATVWSVTVQGDQADIAADLRGVPPEHLTCRAVHPGGAHEERWLNEPDLADVFGIVELQLTPDLYARESRFVVPLAAKSDTLRYYVVASNMSAADLASVTVEDVGHVDDGRPRVNFTRVEAGAFTADHLPLESLVQGTQRAVLFQSTVSLPRTRKPRRRIQLSRNGDVVMPNLPQVGPERATADLILHLSKP